MAYKTYRSQAKKLHLLAQERFFIDIAEAAGFIDRDTVKKVYNAMLFVLYRELRLKGAIRFPQLCDFRLLLAKGRRIKTHYMKTAVIKPDHHQLRISPMYTVKKYFKALDENGSDKILDPYKKILEMDNDGTLRTKRKELADNFLGSTMLN